MTSTLSSPAARVVAPLQARPVLAPSRKTGLNANTVPQHSTRRRGCAGAGEFTGTARRSHGCTVMAQKRRHFKRATRAGRTLGPRAAAAACHCGTDGTLKTPLVKDVLPAVCDTAGSRGDNEGDVKSCRCPGAMPPRTLSSSVASQR